MRENGAQPALLLLHGTGGDEHDLVPLGRELADGRALISPRGRVMESGMARFFRRVSMGVFDEDSIREEANALAEWLGELGLEQPPVALGYSNGANMAAALLLLHPGSLCGAVLWRPMTPLTPEELPDLSGVPVLVTSGNFDPICPPAEARGLVGLLEMARADVEHEELPADHSLGAQDLDLTRAFLSQYDG